MTVFALKIIALITMTIDHLYKIFTHVFTELPLPSIPIGIGSLSSATLISVLGRTSFPIFAYIIAESCRHTKNRKKYILRLLLFAIISEFPYDLAFFGGNSFAQQNVMWTFLLASLAIFIYEDIGRRFIGIIICICFVFLSFYARTDYKGFGVLLIILIYLQKTKPQKLLAAFAAICVYYLYNHKLFLALIQKNVPDIIGIGIPFAFTCLSLVFLAFYNGKRGRKMKWLFYIYYPLHLLILGGIAYL